MASTDNREALLQGYAWNWFALHSGQRLQLVNFWLVAVSFLASAFVEAISSHLSAIAFGVSVAGGVASLAFLRLDVRTRQLVWVSEDALRSFEEAQTAAGSDQRFELIAASHLARTRWFDSYRVIIQALQASMAILFFLAAIYTLT